MEELELEKVLLEGKLESIEVTLRGWRDNPCETASKLIPELEKEASQILLKIVEIDVKLV